MLDMHEQFENSIKREMNDAENSKKNAETLKKLYCFFRLIEVGLAVYLGYMYLSDGGISAGLIIFSVILLLIAPSRFFYSVWLENLNNANLSLANAEILKTKNEVLYEIDQLKKSNCL